MTLVVVLQQWWYLWSKVLQSVRNRSSGLPLYLTGPQKWLTCTVAMLYLPRLMYGWAIIDNVVLITGICCTRQALGCVLYKLCFFDTPFGERSLAIMKGQVNFPQDSPYSSTVHSLISKQLPGHSLCIHHLVVYRLHTRHVTWRKTRHLSSVYRCIQRDAPAQSCA